MDKSTCSWPHIDDLLTVCSIAETKYIYARTVETVLPGDNLHIIQRPVAPLSDLNGTIPLANLEAFVSDSFNKLQQKQWKHTVGFIPAILWYRQAQQSFRASIFPLEMSLYWVVLEVLAGAYVQNQGLAKIKNKKERVKKFISSRGWVGGSWCFIESAMDDWYLVRCASLHEGKLPGWKDTKFERRWRQLAEFVSFALASLLQKQEQNWENQVANRISAYWQESGLLGAPIAHDAGGSG